jgi:Bacterial Ig-like domain (group 2)
MSRTNSSGVAITLAMMGVLSCSDSSSVAPDDIGPAIDGTDAVISSVSVSLASNTIAMGDSTRATATLRDRRGRLVNGSVSWSSQTPAVATVSSAGIVYGVGGGTSSIVATRASRTGSATETVTTPISTVVVASVAVSLTPGTIQIGQTSQATAITRDANNNVLTGRVITWTSSNTGIATVSASGLVTAIAAGSATITALSETKTGTSAITVTDPPPSGGGPVWRGNEPSGMTSIKERSFSSLTEDASWSALESPGASIATDGTAPHSPSGTLHFNYPAGFAGGSSAANSETSVGSYRVFYFCYWIKHSSNWQGHNTGISKHGYVWMGNNPLFVYEAEGAGSGPLSTRMALQGVVAQPNGDGWYGQNLVPSATFTRGQWDYVEILLTGNTSGTADGAMDVYLNGVHVSHWTNIQYSSGTTQWNLFRIYPVWGGIGDVVNADQYLAWDHVYMSGKN